MTLSTLPAEALYALLRQRLHADGGADSVLDFVANKHMIELCARAEEQARDRTRIDYQALTPHDLQTRVALALKGGARDEIGTNHR